VADLRDRVQTALGAAYKIERELGGGGMSRVFVATDTELGRQVVVKVLPPEMGAGVNAERFRREIQLAASLQHPHIVTVLHSGRSGELVWYTMQLIAGESLRARLAREGELPVDAVIRILHDVVDALAYAHEHGVVHRDIKPDNVLISGRHALVTDFGVAKAVSEATGAGTLTSAGVALGTPAYMAPEQAVADPHVDHRADIYAVGILAYEMLTGRTPFAATTAQAQLAAHVTEAPVPVDAHRAAVPPALSALVMRCLAKKPADRVQTAQQLLGQLRAMATPTGATPISSGAATIRRAHPLRVGAVFTFAAATALALVYGLMERLGLPTWVFGGTAVLLAVGLPIVVITEVLERQRALARITGREPAPKGVPAWLTWRRSLTGGGAAFGVLALAAVIYMAMRLLGIGAVGTLLAKGKLKPREPILLAEFENRTADTTLGPTLTEAFRVDLSQSPTVKLLDPQQVAQALERAQRPEGTTVDAAVARDLAQRTGAKAVVTGEIAAVGRGYVLSASVLSASDGSVLTAVRENAADDAALLGALDRLSRDVRERIGESLTSLRDTPPLEQVTTRSLEALRRYSEAIRDFDRGEYDDALTLLRQAVALDSGFAMAWRKMAAALTRAGGTPEQILTAAAKAYSLSDRLPALERNIATASYYTIAEWDPRRVVASYRAALELDPTEPTARYNLAAELTRERKFAAAESLLLNFPEPASDLMAMVQAAQGRFTDARATLDHAIAAQPNDPTWRFQRVNLASSERDFVTADRLSQEFIARQGNPRLREVMMTTTAVLAAARGRLGASEQQMRAAGAIAESRGAGASAVVYALATAFAEARYLDRPAEAQVRIDAVLARHPLASLSPTDRPYSLLAWAYALAGRPAEAERLLREYAQALPDPRRRIALNPWFYDYDQFAARGAIAAAQHRFQDAIPQYRAYYDSSGCTACGLAELADAYDRLGQTDSALAIYRRYLDVPGLDRLDADAENLGPAYRRLGELYEARGDRGEALNYYGKFVELWKDADSDLQPAVRDVKARIGRLAGEH
jgi:eukaryotic-like serine/threonine-protein kinase